MSRLDSGVTEWVFDLGSDDEWGADMDVAREIAKRKVKMYLDTEVRKGTRKFLWMLVLMGMALSCTITMLVSGRIRL